jgi:septal ring factor EnvC (AmiA/AmiB activator)
MSLADRVEAAAASIAVAALTSAFAAGVWVVRRVFTNQQQIAMLQREIETRDDRRVDDREALNELKTDVREMRSEVREIIRDMRT